MSDKLSHKSSSLEDTNVSPEKKDPKEQETPIAAVKPKIEEHKEKKEEKVKVKKETAEDMDIVKRQTLEKQIEEAPIVSKKEESKNPVKPKASTENADASVENTESVGGGIFGFNFDTLMNKWGEWRNKIAFSIGPLLKLVEKTDWLKKGLLALIPQSLGDHVELADALKVNHFEGMTEKSGFKMSHLLAVHKERFSTVSPDVFFLKLAKKARTMTNEKMVDFKTLTEAAESLDQSDFTPDQLVSKQTQTEPEKMKESTDLLKISYPAKVNGKQFRIDPDKALIRGEKFTYKLTHSQLPEMQITRAVLLRDGSMQISVTSGNKTCSGEVKADRLSQIVAGFADVHEVIEVKNGPIGYRLGLEKSQT